MNKTKIDWCDSTWNPVTGCFHGCEYCYARGIANRVRYRKGYEVNEDNVVFNFHLDGSPTIYELNNPCYYEPEDVVLGLESGEDCKRIKAPYPYGFEPTFHKYRLNDYIGKKGRNIFVCSMADLFGAWVPDEWIEEVFKACEKAPQHNYLFLTKNPGRYVELINKGMLPGTDNMWYGYSATHRKSTEWWNPMYNIFASVEPILERMDAPRCKWCIIGAETGRRKDRIVPERAWIEEIVNKCREWNTPIFMKSSLADIWGEPLIQEFPVSIKVDPW